VARGDRSTHEMPADHEMVRKELTTARATGANVEEEEGGKRRRSRAARRKSSLAIISSGREGMTASQLEAPDCRRLRRWEDIATELPTECES